MQKLAVDIEQDILNGGLSEDSALSNVGFNGGESLVSCVNYFTKNPYGMCLNSELPSKKAISLAVKLAIAIDKNSASEVKLLKAQYGATEEFAYAKEFLNRKSKQVWDVFNNRDKKISVPRESMNILGITNLPSLDFMLGDSLKLFESEGSSTTVAIIRSILTNKNLNYTFDDIYNYLLFARQKYWCEYNLKTVTYLIEWTDCNVDKLFALGISSKTITKALQSFTFSARLKYLFKGGLKLSMFPL
ncbi:MAG: hypothetical protein NC191_09215 [Muribaculaceae bacterium]|nr:hypothetical protein [Muribaculaceae bacterium]